MPDLEACLVCFTTDAKFTSMDNHRLREQYNSLTGLQLQKGNGMPEYLCNPCRSNVVRFLEFREKCRRAYFVLEQHLQEDKEINKETLKTCISYFHGYVEAPNKQQHSKKMDNNHRKKSIHVPSPQDNANINLVKHEDEAEITEIDMRGIFSFPNNEELNTQSSSFNDNTEVIDDIDNDNGLDSDDDANISCTVETEDRQQEKSQDQPLNKRKEGDGSVLDEEYGTMHVLSRNEAQAAQAIINTCGLGKHICDVCNRRFMTADRLKTHLSGHTRLPENAEFFCHICNYNYKSHYLLKYHIAEKHMYKYVCKKCPEVSFDRSTAKQHYIKYHLRKENDVPWELRRPSWLNAKGGSRKKGVSKVKKKSPKRKITELPADIVYTALTQEEQYNIVQNRKNTTNYLKSQFHCDLCYKGFIDLDTHENHMKKHDPAISGEFQCDVCKQYFKNHLKIFLHMRRAHRSKFTCKLCNYVCFVRDQAVAHYKVHLNVTYKCPHCDLEFKHRMTRATHVRFRHPSSFICSLCGHGFVSEHGLNSHVKYSHTPEEVEANSQAPVDKTSKLYCADCDILFASDAAFETHLGSSKNHSSANVAAGKKVTQMRAKTRKAVGRMPRRGRGTLRDTEILNIGLTTATRCDICDELLPNDVEVRKHYAQKHPGEKYLQRYMCEVCGFVTDKNYFLKLHMRKHTNERPFKCDQCGRGFAAAGTRDRHMVVHAPEKPFECHICQGRFSQKGSVKMHIQTVHMKIPYAPWDKKKRKQRNNIAAFKPTNPDLQDLLPSTHTSF